MIVKNKKLTIGIILAFIFIASITLTYAYFSANVSGNEDATNQIVTTGTLKLNYVDGPYIELLDAFPGQGIEKEFIVSNIGTFDTEYSINWKNLVNEVKNDELVISYTCKSYKDYYGVKTEEGTCSDMVPQTVGSDVAIPIMANIPINKGITHEYTLRVELIEMSSDQNYNQGRNSAGEIIINEYEIDNLNVPVIQDASVEDLNLQARTIDNVGIVGYSIVPSGSEPGDWTPVSSEKNLTIDVPVDDYDKTIYIKNKTGTVIYRDLTPEGLVIIDPNGGEFPEESLAYGDTYKVSRMSSVALNEPNSIIGHLAYNLKYKESVTVADPIKEGNTFTGWGVSGRLSTINDHRFVMGIEDTILLASWDANPYTLTIRPEGGTWEGSTSNQDFTINFGSSKTVVAPTRKGYTFTGWQLTEGTNSTLNSTTFTMGSADCTLRATWQINDYPWIAYHYQQNILNSNYTLVSADTTTGSATFNTSVTPPVKTYGGFTSPSTQTITIDEDVTPATKNKVDYNYTRNTYNLTYTLNGGSVSGTNPTSLKYKQTSTIISPTKTGYNFNNWTVSGDESSMSGTTLTMGKATTSLSANYTAQSYTLTYNGNGGSTPAAKTITYDSQYGTLATSTRTGYNFAGWYTAASGGTKITATTIVKVTTGQTLFAHWTAATYTVTLNNQGATSAGTTSVTATYGSAMPAITKPTKTGATFSGYYTGANGTGTQYYTASGTSATAYNIAGATTLYAKWSQPLATYLTANYSSLGLTYASRAATGLQAYTVAEYRYKGSAPRNYITFNGETWRIIGVFQVENGSGTKQTRVKIIRNSAYGGLMAFSTNYNAAWGTTSAVYNAINTTYYNSMSATAKAMVGNALWYRGKVSDTSQTPTNAYNAERTNSVVSGNGAATWTGIFGLMYPSDYGLASSTCATTAMDITNWSSTCSSNDWIYTQLVISQSSKPMAWAMNSGTTQYYQIVISDGGGYIREKATNYSYYTYPVAYLNANVTYVSGTGASGSPFQISN